MGTESEKYHSSKRQQYEVMMQTFLAYQTAVNHAAIVSVTDLQGKIIYVNEKFTEISKYSTEELLGKSHHLINSGRHEKEFFRDMWQNISAGKSWRGEIKNKAKDGSYYWVDTVITPIFGKNGNIFQYLSIRNLITRQKENEERLLKFQSEAIKREQQLNDAQKIAKTGSWYLSVEDNNRLEWSDETYRIFEVDPCTDVTYNKFLAMVHPTDREMVNRAWQESLKTGRYDIEHKILTASGEKWVTEHARFEFDQNAVFRNALGTVQDITEKKRIEDKLKESENLYKTLFNNSPFAIVIIEKDTLKFLEVNETALKLYGYSRSEFLQLSLKDIGIAAEYEKMIAGVTDNPFEKDQFIMSCQKKNEEMIYVEVSIDSMKFKGDDRYVITLNDITARSKIEKDLNLAKQRRQKDILEAEEKSRSHIGMELHDNVNQLLAAAQLYLQSVHPSSEKNDTLVKETMNILSNALEEIRKLSASLVMPVVSQGNLKKSIRALADKYELLDVNIELLVNINEEDIHQDLKMAIYRIIQEQLSNIIKHAAATMINIRLFSYDDFMQLQIVDNGRGFDQKRARKGIGIANIIYRAETYGGKVSISSDIDKGCTLTILFKIL